MAPYLLIIMLLNGGAPQFVLPMQSMEACAANQAELSVLMDQKLSMSACFDMGTQSFVRMPERKPPQPPGEEVN